MSVGKYSPTVSRAYQKNQNWWAENGGNTDKKDYESWYDNDGFDSYGYNKDDIDRAGNNESDYLCHYDVEYDVYTLAETTYDDWSVNEKGIPTLFSEIKKTLNPIKDNKNKP